jgi:dihydroxyacetone kinase-like predicted kinase
MGQAGIGSGADMALALWRVSVQARRAVARPVDGTMLSVLSDAALAGHGAAQAGGEVEAVLTAAVEGARASLARTTSQLPELQRAGVVDAGAKGIVLLLDALLSAVSGRAVEEPVGELGPLRRGAPPGDVEPDLTFPFEVQCLVEAAEPAIAALRESLTALGDSVVVVGSDGLYHVHVHTGDPRAAEAVVASAGAVRAVAVADLAEQVAACVGHEGRAVRVGEARCRLVAVVDGAEVRAVFRSLGAVVPVDRDHMASSIEAASGRDDVIVLVAGDAMAPDEGANTAGVRTLVTPSVPAALSAAAAFNAVADLDRNVLDMEQAIEATSTGEVVEAGPGRWVGRVAREDVARNGSASSCLEVVLRRLLAGARDPEVVTVVLGPGAREWDLAGTLAVARIHERIRVQLFEGGPRGPAFAVGVE